MQRLISTFPSAILLHKIYLAIIKEHNLYQTDIDRSQTLRLVIIFCSNLINSLGLTMTTEQHPLRAKIESLGAHNLTIRHLLNEQRIQSDRSWEETLSMMVILLAEKEAKLVRRVKELERVGVDLN